MMFTLEEIKQAIDGKVIYKTAESVYATTIMIDGVSTDTRTIREGDIFFALRGEKFNGNEYAAMALEKGARAVVTDDEKYIPEGSVGIVTDNTTVALGRLAAHYRFKLGAKVIAVTGSVGKTSTRTLIADVLKTGLKIHSTCANNNNEIGMSKTILSAPSDTEYLVVEMGMRGTGEISLLSSIARPDIAVITNIGFSHVGRLGSRDNIMKAKMEIAEGLTDNGILAVNGDDTRLFDYATRTIPFNNLIAGITTTCDSKINCPLSVCAYDVKETEDGMSFRVRIERMGKVFDLGEDLSVGLFGMPGIRNVLFAVFCAYQTGLLDDEESRRKVIDVIRSNSALDGRGTMTETKKYMIMNDAYNASPESMENAFLNFARRAKGRRKVLALGGMLELGDYAPQLHEMTGKACARYGFDRVYVTGDHSTEFSKGAHEVDMGLNVIICKDTEDVGLRLAEYLRDGDAILFKASNSFRFEKLANEFITKGNE